MIAIKYPYLYRDVDRRGNERYYFWRKGQRKIRVREQPGTEEFIARYNELLQTSESERFSRLPGQKPIALIAGTWQWLCVQYFKSGKFQDLEPSTQTSRRRILEATFDEQRRPGSSDKFGACPLTRMKPKFI